MLTLPVPSVFSPDVAIAPDVRVGHAFQHAWRERSGESQAQLRHAIVLLVEQYRVEMKTPEAAVIAFKQTIHEFGGVHDAPGLALDYHADGDECSSAYAQAFAQFIEIYFSPGWSR